MNHARRSLISTSALVLPALALAACAVAPAKQAPPGDGTPVPAPQTAVEQFIAETQAVLGFAAPIVSVISIFVPGAAAYAPIVEAGLNGALNVFNTISSTMTVAQAQPIAGRIVTYIGGSLTAADQAVAVISDPVQRAKAQGIVAQVRGGLGLLAAFASVGGVAVGAEAVPVAVGALRIRTVR